LLLNHCKAIVGIDVSSSEFDGDFLLEVWISALDQGSAQRGFAYGLRILSEIGLSCRATRQGKRRRRG
jgi:hypothetical protein